MSIFEKFSVTIRNLSSKVAKYKNTLPEEVPPGTWKTELAGPARGSLPQTQRNAQAVGNSNKVNIQLSSKERKGSLQLLVTL